jgi:hypothetical protein
MARSRFAAWLACIAVLALALALPAPALPLELEQAKREGLIGERADGFVGVVVANPPSEVEELALQINAKRRERYQQIAQENGTSIDAVAMLAGEKLVARAAKGEWVTDAQGNWRQKK